VIQIQGASKRLAILLRVEGSFCECPRGQWSSRACLDFALGGAMTLLIRAPGCVRVELCPRGAMVWSRKLVLDIAPTRAELFSQASI